jgi:hypothetical protein
LAKHTNIDFAMILTRRYIPRLSTRLLYLLIGCVAIITFFILSSDFMDQNMTFFNSPFRPAPEAGKQRNLVQFPFKKKGVKAGNKAKADAVRQTMKDTFWKYRNAAWGMDEVLPVTGGNSTSRNGWASTIVDSMTTLAIMGLEEEFLLVCMLNGHQF